MCIHEKVFAGFSMTQKVQDKSEVKQIVMIHVQNFADPEHYNRLGVRDEMRDAGVKNIPQAEDRRPALTGYHCQRP